MEAAEALEATVGSLGSLEEGLGDSLGLLDLTLGETNNATCDPLALAFSEAALTIVSLGVFGLIEIVLSFVKNERAANDGVGSAKVGKKVSVLVLSVGIETSLDVLAITDTALGDIEVRVALLGTEGVENLTSRLAAVLQITELVDLEGVKTGLETLEFTDELSQVTRLLGNGETTGGVRVAEEIELASGSDGLSLLGGVLPVGINGGSVVGLDITGSEGASAFPSEAV